MLVWAAPIEAHTPTTFYAKKWVQDKQVNWGFTPSGNYGTNWRDQIARGFAQWNAVGQPMTFIHQTPSGLTDYTADWDPYSCPPVEQRDGIHRRKIDGAGGTLAVTPACFFTGTNELHSFQIIYDTSENWYTGTGTPGNTQVDLWSVTSHETGHATGFGEYTSQQHFSASETICTFVTYDVNNPYHTMCPFIYDGTTRSRSLADHDKHTFDGAY